jgi:4-amino-4-deoxy-L-arabinose transferase-like glycosyltransferase
VTLDGRRLVPALFLVNVALRLPGIFQDLPPFTFCDEDLYTYASYAMFKADSWRPPAFLAGGVSYYLPLLGAKLVTALTGMAWTPEAHLLLSRVLTVVLLGALTPVIVWKIGERFLSRRAALAAALIATLSPMALGLNRIHYPDHYVAFFSAALLYCAWALIRSRHALAWYATAGVLLGVLVSVKYTGGVFVLPILAAHVLRVRRGGLLRAVLAPGLPLAGLTAIATFAIANPFIVSDPGPFLVALDFHSRHYASGHPGLETLHGYRFHATLLFLTSFGVLGGVLWLLGVLRSLRSAERLLLLIVPPIALVLLLGGYRMAINRNLAGALPMVFLAMGLGVEALLDLFARSHLARWRAPLRAGVVALLLVEPLGRTAWSLVNDFEPDARRAAATWLSDNVPRRSVIGFSRACWGVPVKTEDFQVRFQGMPVRLRDGECLDYYVMDSWFYEHWGPGNTVFGQPVYSEHIFLNTGGVGYPAIRAAQDAFLENFEVIQRFDRRYYGPDVTVYRSKRPCPTARVSP